MAAFDIRVDFSALDAQLDALQADALQALRPAAQAGAQVLYDEVRRRVPISIKAHSTKNKAQTYSPGNLRDAIYQVYSKDTSTVEKATYHISWNESKAFYGRFVEYGTVKTAAQPFLRPAYDAAKQTALSAAQARFLQELANPTTAGTAGKAGDGNAA